jgi:small-conductance mechanosensitive channel
MTLDYSFVIHFILPLSAVAIGFFTGLIIEKFIVRRIKQMALKTKGEIDDVIVGSIHGAIIFWFTAAGIYIAILNLPVGPVLISHLIKVLSVIIISSFVIVAARMSVDLIRIYTGKMSDVLPSASIFMNLTRLLVYGLGILIILQTLGISITPILTALGVGGLAVALALQPTLSNLFAGLQILISKQLKPGDYVKLDTGEEGYVVDITWRNTTIRALPNNMIVVPNSKLASTTIITNYYLPVQEMAVLVEVGVGYDSDLQKVERTTIEVAREVMRDVPGGVPEFEPFTRYHTFADFSINFSVIMRAKEYVDQYMIKHEFIKRLHKRYQQEGIEIPFPIRTVYMKES